MERKENDLMLNITANPNFTIQDFATVGLNIENTSLQDKEQYRNHPIIQEKFTDDNGNFNDFEFTNTYNKALINFNEMATNNYDKSVSDFLSYHRDNIFAPEEKIRIDAGEKAEWKIINGTPDIKTVVSEELFKIVKELNYPP